MIVVRVLIDICKREDRTVFGGKDVWSRWFLSWQRKTEAVTDGEGGKPTEKTMIRETTGWFESQAE